jgi:HAD superfamily hydrolase (TIGR01509 family)
MASEVTDLLKLIDEKHYTKLIFDLDETVTRLDVPWEEWKRAVVAALPPDSGADLDRLLSVRGLAWGEIVNDFIAKHPGFYEKFLAASDAFEAKHFAHTPYAELVQALHGLKERGCTLFLWTSNMRQTAERALLELGVYELFERLVTREDVAQGKPDGEGWKYIKQPDEAPDAFLFIGDSSNDAKAAQAANVAYFKINYFK